MPAVIESGRPVAAAKAPPKAATWVRVKGSPLKFVRFVVIDSLHVRVHGYVEHGETIDRVMSVLSARRYLAHLYHDGWVKCDSLEAPPRDFWWPAS